MALEKAQSFCSKKGLSVVPHTVHSAPYNHLGGGDTSMRFRCEDVVSQDEHGECIGSTITGMKQQFGASLTSKVIDRLIFQEGGFGFERLSDQSYPTDEEQRAIMQYGSGYDACWSRVIAVAAPDDKRVMQETTNSMLALMADLSASKLSYGDYAKATNQIISRLNASISEREREALRRNQAENAQRMQSLRALSQEMKQATQPIKSNTTNCTSLVNGNIVTTSCY